MRPMIYAAVASLTLAAMVGQAEAMPVALYQALSRQTSSRRNSSTVGETIAGTTTVGTARDFIGAVTPGAAVLGGAVARDGTAGPAADAEDTWVAADIWEAVV